MSVPDQYMTVVFRDLSVDQRRAIINQEEAVRLSHGDQLAVRDSYAKRIEALETAISEIVARWDADCGSRMAAEIPDAIESARELLGSRKELTDAS